MILKWKAREDRGVFFFFSSRRRHTRSKRDWSSDVCSSDLIRDDVWRQLRPAVLLYAGDFDSSGEDIFRDFVARTDCWTHTRRIALTAEQVETLDRKSVV